MSLRVDGSPIASSLVVGVSGLGILAESIPSTGATGAGVIYNDLDLPTDNGKEVRIELLTLPSDGELIMNEDGSFLFSGAADGAYTFTYNLYFDGVQSGGSLAIALRVGV